MLVYNSKSNIFKKFRKKNKYESLGPKMLRDYINMKNIFEKPSNKDEKNFNKGKNNENENNDSKNYINKLKSSNDGDNSTKNILINLSRRKRSISLP